jgi:hypothetical protein
MFVYFTLQSNGSYKATFCFIELFLLFNSSVSYAGWMQNLKIRKLFLSKRKFCLGEVINGQVSPNITVKEKTCNLRCQPVSQSVSGNMSVGVRQYVSQCQAICQSVSGHMSFVRQYFSRCRPILQSLPDSSLVGVNRRVSHWQPVSQSMPNLVQVPMF